MTFSELHVEQAAVLLRKEVELLLPRIPNARALYSQLDRAVESVTCNIAEARGQQTDRQRARYFAFARGSSDEVRRLLQNAIASGHLSPKQAFRAIGLTYTIGKMTTSLLKHIDRQKR
jgi:four helix bundle protein